MKWSFQLNFTFQTSRRQGHLEGSVWNGAKPHDNQFELIRVSHAEPVHFGADKYTECKKASVLELTMEKDLTAVGKA